MSQTVKQLIDADSLTKIEELYKEMDQQHELESSFKITYEKFLNMLEYLSARRDKHKLKIRQITTVDVIYNRPNTQETYRITIGSESASNQQNIEKINNSLGSLHNRKNHVIFTALLSKIKNDKDPLISILKKQRDRDQILDIYDFGMRVRLATENQLAKKDMEELNKEITFEQRFNIIFRYKQRTSLYIIDDDNATLRIDLTKTKTDKNINTIEDAIPNYELELELTKKQKKNGKYLDEFFLEATNIIKVLQQSNDIITESKKDEVLLQYATLLDQDPKKMTNLDGMQVYSLEIQHVVDQLPNKYSVTDKADGDRYFLLIHDLRVYLISNNLHVKYSGIELNKKLASYNNSIIDGEYIFLAKENKYMMGAFDILFYKGQDIRGEASLKERLAKLDDVIQNCFVFPKQDYYVSEQYSGEMNMKNIINFYTKSIQAYQKSLRKNLDIPDTKLLIRRKFFILPLGGQDNEIFKYAELIWNLYVYDKHTLIPYILDGLVFTPLDQKYTRSVRDTKFLLYKWKPQDKNSIDFYVLFVRNPDTGQIATLFDNSNEDQQKVIADDYKAQGSDKTDYQIKGKQYKICHLYVGQQTRTGEQPTLFQKNYHKYVAYLYLDDGEVRDLEGDPIQDATVVEFYYNDDPSLDDKYKWVPIRTRKDKTEIVTRYKMKYGNYIDVANKVWRSIVNPFTMDDIGILAKDANYQQHVKTLKEKITSGLISLERRENVYFQIRTNLAKPQRAYHNWVKSILIYTYCSPKYGNKKEMTLLDLGVGRGGDLMKFFHAGVTFTVGIDVDNETLTAATDGCVSRYNQFRKGHPTFPKMVFIQADASTILDPVEQEKVLGRIPEKSLALMSQYFSVDESKRMKFDRINIQFSLHYFLANETSWSNFLENINMYLKPGGFVLISCYDAQQVMNNIGDKEQYTVYYTDERGEKKIFVDIMKKYDLGKNEVPGVGNAIDVFNSLVAQEGTYYTEYLVDKRFLVKEFEEKCDLTLVETNLFDNLFYMNTDYFLNTIKSESNERTKDFLSDVAKFWDMEDEVNRASFDVTKLNRYYIFQKLDSGRVLKKLATPQKVSKTPIMTSPIPTPTKPIKPAKEKHKEKSKDKNKHDKTKKKSKSRVV